MVISIANMVIYLRVMDDNSSHEILLNTIIFVRKSSSILVPQILQVIRSHLFALKQAWWIWRNPHLVGGWGWTPLKNMSERQLGWWNSQ